MEILFCINMIISLSFMMTYVPITCLSFFKKVQWKPIRHTVSISLNELQDCGTK